MLRYTVNQRLHLTCGQYGLFGGTRGWQGVQRCQLCMLNTSRSTKSSSSGSLGFIMLLALQIFKASFCPADSFFFSSPRSRHVCTKPFYLNGMLPVPYFLLLPIMATTSMNAKYPRQAMILWKPENHIDPKK